MTLAPTPDTAPDAALDAAAEIALLRRQLERERRARRTAEQVGERSTAQLYDAVQDLEQAQAQLREHLEDQTLINQLSRTLREDLDPQAIVRRAVSSIGAAVGADRCLVRAADGSGIGDVLEDWAGPLADPDDPAPVLPPMFLALCHASAERGESLVIDDVRDDPRIPPGDVDLVRSLVGADSYLGTPMWMGSHLVGWLVLKMTTGARPWTARQIAVVDGVADALGIALMQAEAHSRQSEAIERLELVNQAKGEFVATVSHELRTPLTSIKAYLELLADPTLGHLNEDQTHMLGVATRNTDRLYNLVQDLLALSRVDAGAAPAAAEPMDLVTVVDDVHRAMQPVASRRDVVLRAVCESPAAVVLGDAEQIERAVLNIVSNAVKFTPSGGAVTVTLDGDRSGVVLTVADTGHGIAEADLPHVFDRFYRGASASRLAIQGTGLGLAVVKNTVEQHHGTVTIDSTAGRGTTVTLSLPAAAVGVPVR